MNDHADMCDGKPGDPPYPNMLPMPCPICDSDGWDAWAADPYGYGDETCPRCDGLLRGRSERMAITEHLHIAHCWTCGSACVDGRALTIDECRAAAAQVKV